MYCALLGDRSLFSAAVETAEPRIKVLHEIRGYLRDERGAEIVEWVIVCVILALIAVAVFGPAGPLNAALQAGIQRIANIINSTS